ncbi:hypothetical protein RI129_003404 [Pyrocoelia pectoralis]|uniref:Structure-specific endonuclease subunit SLX4 n=1 Tax=Pyrocoelia pectoralis TaxID=417401 RepID=A0AAN7ZN52_9COLE
MKKCSISKYFKSKESFENVAVNNENLNSSVVSPYKNILNNIQVNLDSSNEANDFKTPKHFNNQTKILPKAHHITKPLVNRKKSIKKKLQLNGQPKINSFVNNEDNVDTNPEHLEMAIALSRSLQNETHPDDLENNTVSKKPSMLGWEQFMYKPSNSKLSVGNRRVGTDRRRDRAKPRYITPVLMIRTQEEREEIIATKISELLSYNVPSVGTFHESVTPLSQSLQSYFNSYQSLFKKSGNTCDIPVSDFYVKRLNLDENVPQCGTLLKDWHKIPGRPVSPVDFRNSLSKSLSVNTPPDATKNCSEGESITCKIDTQTCNSPELFDSDDDNLYITTSNSNVYKKFKNRSRSNEDSSNESSESLLNLTPRKSTILKDTQISSVRCEKVYVDLTHSGDESNDNSTSKDITESGISEILENKNQHRSKHCKLSEENHYCDLTQSSSSEDDEDGNLKTGISEIFKNEMKVNENKSLDHSDAVIANLNVDHFKNKNVQWPQDTFDELFDNEINLSIFTEKVNVNDSRTTISQNNHSFNSKKSEASIIISDDELNYSCNYGRPYSSFKVRSSSQASSFESESFCSDLDQISPKGLQNNQEMNENKGITCTQDYEMNDTILYTVHDVPSSVSEKPHSTTVDENTSTPKSEVIIKTTNVTPSTNYNEMNTPKIERELEKFGIKPLKRKQGIKLLNYIYDSTHPVLNHTDAINVNDNLEDSIMKRRKINPTFQGDNKKETNVTKLVDNALGEREELIFEKTQSKSVASCRIPLHIVWYNLVASDPDLHKSILLYEPLNLEFLHKTIRKHGYKFHVEDLMRFLDKKCITIRTEQHSRHKQKNCKRKSE